MKRKLIVKWLILIRFKRTHFPFPLSIVENKNLIEHVVPIVEINEYNVFLSNPLDIPFPNVIKGSLGKKYNGFF